MLDIVELKRLVKERKLKFFISDGSIYCKNKMDEVVKVGNYTEMIIDDKGILIRNNSQAERFGFTPDGKFHNPSDDFYKAIKDDVL